VLAAVVCPFVHAHDDRDVLVGGGCGDNDLLGTGVDVFAGRGGFGEQTRRLDHDIDSEVGPRQRRRVSLSQDLQRAIANLDAS
jgi:hypothetical protein